MSIIQMKPTTLTCSVGVALQVMEVNDPAIHGETQEWLKAPKKDRIGSDADLWSVLDDLGYPMSLQQLGKHRRKTCSCFSRRN